MLSPVILMQLCKHRFPDIYVGRGVANFADPPSTFHLHTHINAELFCFLRGRASFFVEGTEYILEPGDMLLMRPGESHFLSPDLSQDCDRVIINFPLSLFQSLDPEGTLVRPFLDRKAGQRNRYRLSSFRSDVWKSCLAGMIDPESDRLTLLGNLMLLLGQISDAFCRVDSEQEQADSLEYRIIRYINHNLEKPLQLQDLCRQFFVSRSQLCVAFKRTTGTSVGKYIATKRLFAARQRILRGEKPSEVSQECGYPEYSTFYRAYCRHFGHTPKEDLPTSSYDTDSCPGDADI